MANYSFIDLLSPLDFEHLAKDILSRELKVDLKSFAEGKDKGVDLRYSRNDDESIIIQCKRVKSISKKLLEEEKEKIEKLNPTRYFLVFAIDISIEMTDFITDTFSDWMNDDSNIYTKSRLNNLLDEYVDIHQKQYKLWLNSSTIFNRIINQPLFERAKSLISDLKRDYKYYVKNESLNKAFEILNENQFIIISGIPGIGKTTLAKLILWEYLQKDFEIIEIRKIIEGEQVLIENSELNQVFYFDDFLGENFLKYDVIEGRANDLVQFLKRIKNSKNKKLVMTTREYILNQAKETYEKLDSPELNNKPMQFGDFEQAQKLCAELEEVIEKALDNIDNIEVPEEDQESVGLKTIGIINEPTRSFVDRYLNLNDDFTTIINSDPTKYNFLSGHNKPLASLIDPTNVGYLDISKKYMDDLLSINSYKNDLLSGTTFINTFNKDLDSNVFLSTDINSILNSSNFSIKFSGPELYSDDNSSNDENKDKEDEDDKKENNNDIDNDEKE